MLCLYGGVIQLRWMRVRRLVFRGHLLPSFVTPFRHLRDFLQVVHPVEMETILSLKGEQMEAHMGKFEKEYETVRSTIHQQLVLYRQTHLLPLLHCPTFYDTLHESVLNSMRLMSGVNYEQAERTVKKKAVFTTFMGRYRKFKEKNSLPTAAIFLPPCLYLSPQEVALNEDRQWHTLTPDQQTSYALVFNRYLAKHHEALMAIAGDATLPLTELLRLMKEELEPLPPRLKDVLLP